MHYAKYKIEINLSPVLRLCPNRPNSDNLFSTNT